jgi:hypothetical protein
MAIARALFSAVTVTLDLPGSKSLNDGHGFGAVGVGGGVVVDTGGLVGPEVVVTATGGGVVVVRGGALVTVGVTATPVVTSAGVVVSVTGGGVRTGVESAGGDTDGGGATVRVTMASTDGGKVTSEDGCGV